MPQVDLDHSVGYALKQTSVALRTAMDAELRPLGLSVSQYSCLEVLGHRPGISAAEAARATFVTRQSMHTVLLGLQDRGLLARPTTAPQGRALPTELTDAGRRLLHEASSRVAAIEQRMLGALALDRQRQLQADLAACAAALDDRPDGVTEPIASLR